MAKRRGGLKADSNGQYYRQIGYKHGAKGQPKFRLGRDRVKAELAYHRLGALWEVVVEYHRAAVRGTFLPPGDFEDRRPLWTDEALFVAEAIRKHQHTVLVGQPDHIHGEAAYAAYLDYLREIYGHLVHFQAADHEAAEEGRQRHQSVARHRSRQARHAARIAAIPVPDGTLGATLYQALDQYAERARRQPAKESGKVEAGNAARLKDATPDMDLGAFGFSAMEKIRDYWAARPEAKLRGGKTTGRPISITTVDNHLSTARRFVRWLDRSDQCEWELPRHGLDALKVNLKRLRTDAELAQRRHGVSVFTAQQLSTIYRHATDFERLLLLLGLNAAMAQAEIITLQWGEVEGDTIKRIRRKSGVYAEFYLWDETRRALDWWQRVRPAKGDAVMLTDRGQPYTRQRISNTWRLIHDRIERGAGEAPAWWLPFKHLRKTAASLVRQASDGEIAGVFLSHGQPVATDDLADAYSNRPFNKVADALRTVRAELAPMFEAAPAAFEAEAIGSGPSRRRSTGNNTGA